MVVALVDVLHQVWWNRHPAVARWLRPVAVAGIPAVAAGAEQASADVAVVAVVARSGRLMLFRSRAVSNSRAPARARLLVAIRVVAQFSLNCIAVCRAS